jgi:hypothetical protein
LLHLVAVSASGYLSDIRRFQKSLRHPLIAGHVISS